jgi:hypothetical protein
MFAILITEENMPKILQDRHDLDANTVGWFTTLFNKKWWFISGYVDHRGILHSWSVLPLSYTKRYFEYDPIKIQTDWDLIVRK